MAGVGAGVAGVAVAFAVGEIEIPTSTEAARFPFAVFACVRGTLVPRGLAWRLWIVGRGRTGRFGDQIAVMAGRTWRRMGISRVFLLPRFGTREGEAETERLTALQNTW